MHADLTDRPSYPLIISRSFAVWGGLDAALIAHGILPDQLSVENDPALLLNSIEINYISVVSLLMQLAIAFEEQRFGVLAVIGSVAGDRGRRSNYVYGSAKSALATFVAGLRLRLAAANVQVVLIKPGWVSTPMTAHLSQNFLFVSAEQVRSGSLRRYNFTSRDCVSSLVLEMDHEDDPIRARTRFCKAESITVPEEQRCLSSCRKLPH